MLNVVLFLKVLGTLLGLIGLLAVVLNSPNLSKKNENEPVNKDFFFKVFALNLGMFFFVLGACTVLSTFVASH